MTDQTASRRRRASARRPLGSWTPSGPAQSSSRTTALWRDVVARRIVGAAVIFGAWTTVIEGRLIYLQVIQHEQLVARATRQQMRTVPASAKRGDILDRRGRVLAYSVDADTVYAVPSEIKDAELVASTLCDALDDCSERERQTIARRLGQRRAFAYVRRQTDPDEARRVAALQLDGIGFLKETRRYYPNKELAAHLLGYVGVDSVGLHGVESAYDGQIRGRAGTILIQTDARHRAFSRIERPPTAGATLELTIDHYLQYVAERELRAAVDQHQADGGTVLIMDPHSGELLALANEPTFNPNAFAKYDDDRRRNRATQDVYEPGSTFKMITASAALEEHVMEPTAPIDVSAGMIRLRSRQITDIVRHDTLSFEDVIVRSSNVGAVKIGLELGSDRLGRYVRRFGFGQRLSRDFQGESAGILRDPMRWTEDSLASISMGYEIGVTPLQMATAASAIANGGVLLEPRLVHAVVRGGGRVESKPRIIRRAIGSDTSTRLTAIMEQVVARGSGRGARIPGYRIAGKTGTSAKLVDGRYSKSSYNASFVGFVPSTDPAFTILVVIDNPSTGQYYGGQVAAPVFSRVADAALRHHGIAPTVNPRKPLIVVRDRERTTTRPITFGVGHASRSVAPVTIVAAGEGLMPNMRGLSAREALRELVRVGLTAHVTGQGLVAEQVPAAGTPIGDAAFARLSLDRRSSSTRVGAP